MIPIKTTTIKASMSIAITMYPKNDPKISMSQTLMKPLAKDSFLTVTPLVRKKRSSLNPGPRRNVSPPQRWRL